MTVAVTMTPTPRLYRVATRVLTPLVHLYLRRRRRRGKEDPQRLGERFGIAGLARQAGPLVWIHAASVGEAMSVLALIERFRRDRPELEILVTTGTVASARLLEQRLPTGVRHQYVPVDLPVAVRRFLDHWRPAMALWVESELWPNLVLETRRRGIPMALINARLSARSHARWMRWPGLAGPMLAAFSLCLAQDEAQAERFRQLGAAPVGTVGDLKTAAAPLPADADALAALRDALAGRPAWLAASTHAGEEEIAGQVHRALADRHPGLLTVIAPRHPARGPAIREALAAKNLQIASRSRNEAIGATTDIYLADTMGELGLFYRLADVAFVGGSLSPMGGHNPFEPARLGCAVLHGPDMRNCREMAAFLAAIGAAATVNDAAELIAAVATLLALPAGARRAATTARIADAGKGVLDATVERLAPFLSSLGDPLGPTSPGWPERRQRTVRPDAVPLRTS